MSKFRDRHFISATELTAFVKDAANNVASVVAIVGRTESGGFTLFYFVT